MARPRFDFDPESPEALAAAQAPLSDFETAPMSEDAGDYGQASVGTRESYAVPAQEQMDRTASDAARYAAAARQSMRERGLAFDLGTAADSYEQSGLSGLSLIGAEVPYSRRNPDFEGTRRFVNEMRRATASGVSAQDVLDQNEVAQAHLEARALGEIASETRRAAVDQRARQYAQEEMAIRGQERSARAFQISEQALQRASAATDVDPNRWWASKTQGQRVRTSIMMALRGLGGRDPLDVVRAGVGADIDAQKATFSNRADAAKLAQGNVNLARGLYQDIRNQIGDEREADEAYRLVRMQMIRTDFEAEAASLGLPAAAAHVQKMRAAFDQEIAKLTRNLDHIAAHNAKRITGWGPAYRAVRVGTDAQGNPVYGRQQVGGAGDKQAIDYALDQAGKARAASTEVATAEDKARRESAAAAAAGPSIQERRLALDEAKFATGGTDQDQARATLALIDEWESKYGTDLPLRTEGTIGGEGVYWDSRFTTEEAANEKALRESIGAIARYGLSGKQIAQYEGSLLEPLVSGKNMSGDQLRSMMKRLKTLLGAVATGRERAVSNDTRAKIRGVTPGQLPPQSPDMTGLSEQFGEDASEEQYLEMTPYE